MQTLLKTLGQLLLFIIGGFSTIIAIVRVFAGQGRRSVIFLIASLLILPTSYKSIAMSGDGERQMPIKRYIIIVTALRTVGCTMNIIKRDQRTLINKTIMEINHNIDTTYTTGESIVLDITQAELTALSINDTAIDIQGSGWTHELPLELGQNSITIIGTNEHAVKKWTGSIERITPTEEAQRIENKRIEDAKTAKEEQARQAEKKKEEVQEAKKLIQITTEQMSLMDSKRDDAIGSIDGIQRRLILYKSLADTVHMYKESENEEVSSMGDNLERQVSQKQAKEFPLLREAYGKLLKKNLWVENIDVSTIGGDHGTLELVGGRLASNRNKKQMLTTIGVMMRELRFNRVNMKRYEYDNDYTYWDIDGGLDTEVRKP